MASVTSLFLIGLLFPFYLWGWAMPAEARHPAAAQRKAFQRSIIDKRSHIHPQFRKQYRQKTQYIIVHTSEASHKGTLNAVLKGKFIKGRRVSFGGHAHYVIARNGRVYRTLDKRYIADHAGLSMWMAQTNISRRSIGIELVGYHYQKISANQYRALATLLAILQRVYGLSDREVLTHSQVAYGRPNRWFKSAHRGRKRCAKNFDRSKAGLGPTWPYDPDVKAGRLQADPELAALFYGPRHRLRAISIASNQITTQNTAWEIAGEDHDSPNTHYQLPNGLIIPGDKLEQKIGWNRIPKGTLVLLNQGSGGSFEKQTESVKILSKGVSAWKLLGAGYKKRTTIYFFPNGDIRDGSQVSDWDRLPANTKVIEGYERKGKITRQRYALDIAGSQYSQKNTLYFFPDARLISGANIRNFKSLPPDVEVFLPAKNL
jgi:N-acetyl-anhydromuramyl-L-alanine amidase AmpD